MLQRDYAAEEVVGRVVRRMPRARFGRLAAFDYQLDVVDLTLGAATHAARPRDEEAENRLSLVCSAAQAALDAPKDTRTQGHQDGYRRPSVDLAPIRAGKTRYANLRPQ